MKSTRYAPLMPSATYRHEAATPLPADQLWERLQVAETWASIGPVEKVWDARYDNGLLSSFRWSTSVGHSAYEGTAQSNVVADGEKMVLHLATKELVGALTADVAGSNKGS